jgi:hypothetical protein
MGDDPNVQLPSRAPLVFMKWNPRGSRVEKHDVRGRKSQARNIRRLHIA